VRVGCISGFPTIEKPVQTEPAATAPTLLPAAPCVMDCFRVRGAAPPVWEAMVSVDVRLLRARCGEALDFSRDNRSVIARPESGAIGPHNRASLEPFPFTRAEVDITLNAGVVCFGVRESSSREPSSTGVYSPDVLAVWTDEGGVCVRGEQLDDILEDFHPQPDVHHAFGPLREGVLLHFEGRRTPAAVYGPRGWAAGVRRILARRLRSAVGGYDCGRANRC
jgi:hypothetical protein